MENKYFKERQEQYEEMFKENSDNIINQKISLRKSKKNETLMSKREKVLSNKKSSIYEPNIEKGILSEKVLSLYREEKSSYNNIEIIITKYFNQLQNSSERNDDIYFILDRLLFIISSMNEETLYQVIDHLSLGHKFFDLFEMYNDKVNKIHIYQTFKILVNISMRKNKYLMNKLINLTSISYINNFLSNLFKDPIDNSELIYQIILFLMNLLEDNSYIQFIYYKYKIFDLLYQFILDKKDTNDKAERNINHHIIAFFSLFIAVTFDENEEVYITDKEMIINKLYNLFEFFLTHNYENKDLLLDVVWGLSNLLINLRETDTFIDSIIKKYFDNILNQLFILIKMDNDFVVPIFRIIGNLTSLKDSYCEIFFDSQWSSYLLDLLNEKMVLPKNKILIIWILHNICAGTKFQCMKKYNMNGTLINVLNNENNSDVIFHILKLYYQIINNSKDNFWSDDLVEAIILTIKKDINLKINFVCCFLCEKIFDSKNQNYIKKLNEIGIKEILENWINLDNEEIRMSASYILDNYFKNNNA